MDFYAPDGIQSKEALHFAYVLEQGFDRSCGFAAAATLLSLYWKMGLEEADLLGRYAGDKLREGRLEVNFADLAAILGDYGFAVKCVKMNWAQLGAALGRYAPILLHYIHPDHHFALAIYAKDGWIITLDPALGMELQSRGQFMERWSGAALLAWSSTAVRNEALLADAIQAGEARHEGLAGTGSR